MVNGFLGLIRSGATLYVPCGLANKHAGFDPPGEPALADVMYLLSAMLLLQGITLVPEATLVKDLQFRALALAEVLATLISCAIAIGSGLFRVWHKSAHNSAYSVYRFTVRHDF